MMSVLVNTQLYPANKRPIPLRVIPSKTVEGMMPWALLAQKDLFLNKRLIASAEESYFLGISSEEWKGIGFVLGLALVIQGGIAAADAREHGY